MCEANRACLNRLAVNIDSGDMLARDVPEAHHSAAGHIDINRGRRGGVAMDGSCLVRSIGYAGCTDPWIFEGEVVVIAPNAVWILRHHCDRAQQSYNCPDGNRHRVILTGGVALNAAPS